MPSKKAPAKKTPVKRGRSDDSPGGKFSAAASPDLHQGCNGCRKDGADPPCGRMQAVLNHDPVNGKNARVAANDAARKDAAKERRRQHNAATATPRGSSTASGSGYRGVAKRQAGNMCEVTKTTLCCEACHVVPQSEELAVLQALLPNATTLHDPRNLMFLNDHLHSMFDCFAMSFEHVEAQRFRVHIHSGRRGSTPLQNLDGQEVSLQADSRLLDRHHNAATALHVDDAVDSDEDTGDGTGSGKKGSGGKKAGGGGGRGRGGGTKGGGGGGNTGRGFEGRGGKTRGGGVNANTKMSDKDRAHVLTFRLMSLHNSITPPAKLPLVPAE
jgi:hypothetical protein